MRQLKISKQITNRESQSLDKYLPVSYTHLDVYKRQDIYSERFAFYTICITAAFTKRSFIQSIQHFMQFNVVTKTITLPDNRTITIETGKLAKQADGAVAVSYTHLDVYKRQVLPDHRCDVQWDGSSHFARQTAHRLNKAVRFEFEEDGESSEDTNFVEMKLEVSDLTQATYLRIVCLLYTSRCV